MKRIILAVALVTVAACGGGNDEAATTTVASAPATDAPTTTAAAPTTTTEAPVTTDAATETTTTVLEEVSFRQPLTGEPAATESDLVTLPAIAVKIDNNNANARPNHSGLANADIVFEEIVEFGTRFAAVFHTQGADPLGPIRSGREQDVDLLSSFNQPLFAWSGGNPGVTRLIRDSVLTDLNASVSASRAYYRGPGRAPHDLYSSTDALYEFTPDGHPGAPVQHFTYVEPGDSFVGQPVASFEVGLDNYTIAWEWDDAQGAFARFQQGSRHVDVVNGDIFATNVVVMAIDYIASSIDRNAPDGQTVGSGPVWVFSDGAVVSGRWERNDPAEPLRFVDADGNDIALNPGNTWVELADNSGGGEFTTRTLDGIDRSAIPQIDLGDPAAFPADISIVAG